MTTNPEVTSGNKFLKLPSLASVLSWSGVVAFGIILSVVFNSFITLTVVSGNSMLPTYQSGDLLVAVKQAEYKLDDVIVYKPNTLECDRCNIVHRIVGGSEAEGWITQGDNNPNTDPWMPKSSEISGSVQQHFSFGQITFLFFSPNFWLMIISIIAVAFMLEKGIQLIIQHRGHKKSLANTTPMVN